MTAKLRSFLAAPIFTLACGVLLAGAFLMWCSALLDSAPLSRAADWMEGTAARRERDREQRRRDAGRGGDSA